MKIANSAIYTYPPTLKIRDTRQIGIEQGGMNEEKRNAEENLYGKRQRKGNGKKEKWTRRSSPWMRIFEEKKKPGNDQRCRK